MSKDYRLYVISPPLNNDAILQRDWKAYAPEWDYDALNLPTNQESQRSAYRNEKVMRIMCARGEYEPASFVVETNQPLEQVMVRVGLLKGRAGTLASETVDVRIAMEVYRTHNSMGPETVLPWVLVHDPGMWEVQADPKMNRLIKPLIDTDTLQPGDIEDVRQFWLTVHMPDDAKAGTYRGDVTITAANAPATVLTLEVTVPTFDLREPTFHYGAYYPTLLHHEGMTEAQLEKYHPVSKEQYLAECRNMVEHGCTNPVSYVGAEFDQDGNIDFTRLDEILDIREKAGMPKGVPLFTFDGAGVLMKQGPLTDEQKRSSTESTRKVVDWVRRRGYTDACFMAGDELRGERLGSQRDSLQAIRDGGGKIWVACSDDFLDFIGDLLDVPVLHHPGHLVGSYGADLLMTPEYQKIITSVHERGFKIFTYMDPIASRPLPASHRRYRGLGMFKTGVDGTMTWAYTHIWEKTRRFDDPHIQKYGLHISMRGFVLRGPKGVLDTLNWEAYREGYDDARYLATLQDAIARAKAAGRHERLAARTERWLGDVTVNADLDAWRLEMARRTEALLKP